MRDRDTLRHALGHGAGRDPVHVSGQSDRPPSVRYRVYRRLAGRVKAGRDPDHGRDILHRVEQHLLQIGRDIGVGDIGPRRRRIELVHQLGHDAAGDRIVRYCTDRAAVVVHDADTEEACSNIVAVYVRVPDVIDRSVSLPLVAGIGADRLDRVLGIYNIRITLRGRAQHIHRAVADLCLEGCQHVHLKSALPAAEDPAPAADEVVSVEIRDMTVYIFHRVFDMTEAVGKTVSRYDQRRSKQVCDILDLDRQTEVSGHLRHDLGAVQSFWRLIKVN